MVEQLSAIHKTHDEVQFVRGLEGEFKRDDERVVHQGENGPLSEDVGNLSGPGSDVGFSDGLESVYPLSVFLPNLHHLSERALSDHLEKIESIDREGHVPGWLEIDLEVEGTRTGGGGIPLVGSMLGRRRKHVSPICWEDGRIMRWVKWDEQAKEKGGVR